MRQGQKTSGQVEYQYEVAGIRVASNTHFLLPQAATQEGRASDIVFTLKLPGVQTEERFAFRTPIGRIRNGAGRPTITVYEITDGFLLDCNNANRKVEFVITCGGSCIACYPQVDTLVEDIQTWLFGLVWAFLLQGRGLFSLHGAAIAFHGRAIAFLGPNGYGKSTLALFFLQQGHSLVTDDVLPIVQKEDVPFAVPACPSMNLWPEAVSHFNKPNANGTSVAMSRRKHRYSLETLKLQFCKSDIPLGAIYFLNGPRKEENGKVHIKPIPQGRALVELLAYTRANSMISLPEQKELLRAYANLVRQVPVRHLDYPRSFECLPTIYEMLLQDISK